MTRTRGYTLTEMLVALTIVMVLVGLFVPMLVQAKAEAKKSACGMNFKQVFFSSTLYQVDFDDRYVVPKYVVSTTESSENDRTWVQLLAPYLRNLQLTRCPSDYTNTLGIDPVFDADLVFGVDAERYYQASRRANSGFNFVSLAPMVKETDGKWYARPHATTEPQDPGKTLVFGDSVWDVTAEGQPIGGGSYLLVPPCRYNAVDGSDSFGLSTYKDDRVFTAQRVWDDAAQPHRARFGGLWPWHTGRATSVMADGSVKALTVQQLSEGCRVRAAWGGQITDAFRYLWDLR